MASGGKKAGRPGHQRYNMENRRYVNKLRRAKASGSGVTKVVEYRPGYNPGRKRSIKASS